MSRRSQVQANGVSDLDRAARQFRTAEAKLHWVILGAHEAGSSLRSIALVTKFSHEKVRTILAAERRRLARDYERLERLEQLEPGLNVSDKLRNEATARRLRQALPVRKSDGHERNTP
jgi:hypothetical protein